MENENRRQVAILTDSHGLLEPTKAALDDMERRGITEIYSLGDNIGVGPNPGEVLDLLEERGVISLAGNAEDYVRLGIEPFSYYFNEPKRQSQLWTLSKLSEHQIEYLSSFPHSIKLSMGNKSIGLCHFASDVRFDFHQNSTWAYQGKIDHGIPGYPQFFHTNSIQQLQYMEKILRLYGKNHPLMRGYLSGTNEPLFNGKTVNSFDAIIQGHVHFKIHEASDKTDFYSIRAVGAAYKDDPIDTASYVILTEKDRGFDLEEVLVKFDRERMEYSIRSSDCPGDLIYKYTSMGRKLKK